MQASWLSHKPHNFPLFLAKIILVIDSLSERAKFLPCASTPIGPILDQLSVDLARLGFPALAFPQHVDLQHVLDNGSSLPQRAYLSSIQLLRLSAPGGTKLEKKKEVHKLVNSYSQGKPFI